MASVNMSNSDAKLYNEKGTLLQLRAILCWMVASGFIQRYSKAIDYRYELWIMVPKWVGRANTGIPDISFGWLRPRCARFYASIDLELVGNRRYTNYRAKK